jgi:HAD superfamily hydrolase (TIGR01509 family)
MAGVRAILFDFNGVLVDDEPIHLELFQRVLREEGVEVSAEDYFSRLIGFDDRDCFQTVLSEAGRPAAPDRVSRLIARKSTYYHERIREQGFPFFDGAAELIADAAASDLMLGVVSGALRDEVEGAIDQLGARRHFKCLVTADDVDAGKPDPEGYRRGLDGLNSLPPLPSRLLHPHEVLAIEDTPAGLRAAAAVGLATLGVAQTHSADRLTLADKVVESVRGLSVPHLRSLFAGG